MNHSAHEIYNIEIKKSKYIMVMDQKVQYKNVTCPQIGSYIIYVIPIRISADFVYVCICVKMDILILKLM